MNVRQTQGAKALFLEVIERPAEERQRWLTRACDGDTRLLAEVQELLSHAEDDASGLLVTPPFADGVAEQLRDSLKSAADGPFRRGQRLGPYTIEERIGQGGMSVVYRARQSDPIDRDVAIKVLRQGLDSEAFLRRFELERRVLATMEHPNIARVLDAGTCPEGQSYFVMELVRGPSLIEFCDERELDVRRRIDIFLQVCRGVHHAHMRGIIHRDLKPSNILVTDHDGVPTPKVIDFGVSKAIDLPDGAGHTLHGEPVGTPAYMSPEQWASGVEVDIRTDVYSLGTVLFELFSGRCPYPFETAESHDPHTIRGVMERSDPTRVSDRVRKDSEAVCSKRGVTGSELARTLRGDLDAVLLMAVAKDRDKRYQSVDAFAADLVRYLTHQPTHARPPGPLHLARMFCRRHQTLTAATALIAFGVVVAIAASVYHVTRVEREFGRTKEALARSERAEAQATARARELGLVLEFQEAQIGRTAPERIGDSLKASILESTRSEDKDLVQNAFKHINFTNIGLDSLREGLFEPTRAAIDDQFSGEPIIESQLLQTLGNTLHRVGLYDEAAEPMQRAVALRREFLGDQHRDTLSSIDRLGTVRGVQGRLDEAEALIGEALEGRRAVLGDSHSDTIGSLNNMGLLLARRGRLQEARPYFDETIRRLRANADSTPEMLFTALDNTGQLYANLGMPARAEALLREALGERRVALGDDHPNTFRSMNSLGGILVEQGRMEEAETLYRVALEGRRRILGDDHSDTISSVHNMAFLLAGQEKYAEARAHYQQVLDSFNRIGDRDHIGYLITLSNMGNLLGKTGELEQAESFHRRSVAGYRRVFGESHPSTGTAIHNLAVLLERSRKFDEAASLYAEVVEASRRDLGDDHPDTLIAITRLATVFLELDNPSASEPLAREYMEAVLRSRPQSASAIEARVQLAKALVGLERYHEAESILVDARDTDLVETDTAREDELRDDITVLLDRVRDKLSKTHIGEQ